MYTTKQTRTYPPEFTVVQTGSDTSAVFHGPDAQARADEYAAFKNAATNQERE
jgi:hypothetical protein